MRISVFVAIAALGAVGCDSTPSAPEPTTSSPLLARDGRPAHENYRAPFARTVTNPCPPAPEPVAIEGYLTFNAHFKFFEGGNSPRIKHGSHGSGRGLLTGARYQLHEVNWWAGDYTYANQRLEVDQFTRLHVVSQTGFGNFFSSVRHRIVCDETGCTTTVVSVDTDCRG